MLTNVCVSESCHWEQWAYIFQICYTGGKNNFAYNKTEVIFFLWKIFENSKVKI